MSRRLPNKAEMQTRRDLILQFLAKQPEKTFAADIAAELKWRGCNAGRMVSSAMHSLTGGGWASVVYWPRKNVNSYHITAKGLDYVAGGCAGMDIKPAKRVHKPRPSSTVKRDAKMSVAQTRRDCVVAALSSSDAPLSLNEVFQKVEHMGLTKIHVKSSLERLKELSLVSSRQKIGGIGHVYGLTAAGLVDATDIPQAQNEQPRNFYKTSLWLTPQQVRSQFEGGCYA